MGNNLFARHPSMHVTDCNHAIYAPDPNPTAHRIASIRKVFENTAEVLEPIFNTGAFPVVIGGDHSVAAGTIAAIRKTYPQARLGVVWIDAHADLHTPYTTPSGNFHGMPLAISLGVDNLEKRKNTPYPQTVTEWNEVKGLWGIAPKIKPEDLVFFGVRDTEDEEDALIVQHDIRNFTVGEVRERGSATCTSEATDRLAGCDIVYVSFDVDSMDPTLTSHGTGTPVLGGFSPAEAMTLIEQLFEALPVVCFEMVEINPTLDEKCNVMAEVAHGLLEHAVQCALNKPRVYP